MDNYLLTPQLIDKKAHLQRYARAVMADKLRAEGFVSYKNEDLSWYKIVNGDMLLSVYIHTNVPIVPLIPVIGYGMHALFVAPPIPQKVTVRGWSSNEIMTQVHPSGHRRIFDKQTMVQCVDTEECGAEELDDRIFPIFSRASSMQDAFNFYKSRHFYPSGYAMSNVFIDMAIWLDDKEIYPACLRKIEGLRNFPASYFKFKRDFDYENIDLWYAAIAEGRREEYLEILKERKEQVLLKLEKKLNIRP